MANELDTSNIDVVGQSLNEQPAPTKVPRAGQVSSVATAEMPGAPVAAEPTPQPTGDFNPADYDTSSFNPNDYEAPESYADGLTPETAINKSPVDIVDRFKLALGNKVGKLNFLKSKFEDAQIDKTGNFKVKKDGSWYNVDANGLGDGDAWDRTKELVKDIADVSDQVILAAAQIGGAKIGSRLAAGAGPIGAVVGGAAGAAIATGAAEGLRTSLGRLAGTYDATPEENLKDIGTESLLGLGGEVVGLGIKPTFKMLQRALENIGARGSNYAKELISATSGGLNNVPNGRWSYRRAMDDARSVIPEVERGLKMIAPTESPKLAIGPMTDVQSKIMKNVVSDADVAIKSKYTKNLGELLSKTPDNFKFDASGVVKKTMSDMADAGLGRINERGQLEVLSQSEISKLLRIPEHEIPQVIDDKTRQAVGQIANLLNQYSEIGVLEGKIGAKKAVDLRKKLRLSFENIAQGSDVNDTIRGVVGKIKSQLEEGIGQSFADNGVADQFIKLNSEYASHINAVKLAKDALQSGPQGVDKLLKNLIDKGGTQRSLQNELFALGELGGQDKLKRILDIEAAKAFVDVIPRTVQGGDMLSTAAKAALGTTVASPQALSREIKYGSKLVDFIKSTHQQGFSLLQDDAALAAAYRTVINASSQEDTEFQKLMREAGIDPSQLPEQ